MKSSRQCSSLQLSHSCGEYKVPLFLLWCVWCVEFEKDNVTVLHNVVPSLLSVLPSRLRNSR